MLPTVLRRMVRPLALLALALASAAGPHASARGCEPAWGPGFNVRGTDGSIGAFAIFDDGSGPALYAAGAFSVAGSTVAQNIAKWDGLHWAALPGGPPTQNGGLADCGALCVFDDGSGPALYVAGDFDQIGSIPASRIARWDGVSWSALGDGVSAGLFSASIDALAVHDDGTGPALYAGGFFTTAGPVSAKNVAKWKDGAWSAMGAGVTGDSASTSCVRTMFSANLGGGPLLYVGGFIMSAGGSAANRGLVTWNGAAWDKVGVGLRAVGSIMNQRCDVSTAAVYDSGSGPEIFASGSFVVLTPGGDVSGFARFHAPDWTSPPAGGPGVPSMLTSLDDGSGLALYANASASWNSSVLRWNGAAWSTYAALQTSQTAAATAMARFGADVYLAGAFGIANGVPLANLARISAGVTHAVTEGDSDAPNDDVQALAFYDDGSGPSLYAGGLFSSAGDLFSGPIARWTGAAWTSVGPLLFTPQGGLAEVSTMKVFNDGSGDALFVGGNFSARTLKWNGSQMLGIINSTNLTIVNCFAVFDDGLGPKLYVAGTFNTLVSSRFIARLESSQWVGIPTINPTGGIAINALAVHNDGSGPALYMLGSFTAVSGVPATNKAARWNGTTVSSVGGGLSSGTPHAALSWDDGSGPALYVGGSIRIGATGDQHSVIRFRNGAWEDAGLSNFAQVSAFETFDDGSGAALYAGGRFNPTDVNAPPTALARWDGQTWSAVGAGDPLYSAPDQFLHVIALASRNDPREAPELWAGGHIALAQGQPSVNLARYSGCADTTCPGDANGDGVVNFADLNLVLSNYGQSGAGIPGDVNNDGVVNFADLNIVLSNFGLIC